MPSDSKESLIYVVYAVALVDLFSASMITTCLAMYLTDELEMSSTTAGIVGSIYGIVQFASGPLVGSWSDVHGCKVILVRCLIACVPAYILLASSSWTLVIAARILAGGFKHTQTLCRTYVAGIAKDSEKIHVYGRLNAMGNIGFIVGPALEAWLLANYDYSAVFYCTSVAFLANAAIVYCLFPQQSPAVAADRSSDQKPKISPNPEEETTDKKSSITSILYQPVEEFFDTFNRVDWSRQWDLMLTRFLLSFAVLLYRGGYSWMLQTKYNVDGPTLGYLTSYQGLISFLVSACAGYLAIFYQGDSLRLYEHTIVLMFFSLLALLVSNGFYSYALSLIPFCISTSIMRVITLELATERSGKAEIGLILGVSASVVSIGRALTPALAGILHDWHRDAAAIVCLIFTVISLVVTNVYSRYYTYYERKSSDHVY